MWIGLQKWWFNAVQILDKRGGSDLLQNGFGTFLQKTMKTLQIDWPDPENHCFLQNTRLHHTDFCANPEQNLVYTGLPPLFCRGNLEMSRGTVYIYGL